MKTTKIISLTVIVLGLSVLLYGVAFTGWFSSPVTCDMDSRATLAELQQACADEILANKETYQYVTSRNDEIRAMMGWSDKDLVSLGLIETK